MSGVYFSQKLSIFWPKWSKSAFFNILLKIGEKIFSSKKAEKIEVYRSKNLVKIVNIWTFSSALGISFFHCPSFSGVRKWDVTSKIFLLKHVLLRSPDWGNTEKRNFCWISSELPLTFVQEYKAQFFHSGRNQNRFTCGRVLLSKIDGFVSCVTVPIVRKFWKVQSFLIQTDSFNN